MNQEQIMASAGYVPAAQAARALGISNVGSIHRSVSAGQLIGRRAGRHWYVSVASLLKVYAEAEPLVARIKELGVEPNPEHLKEKDDGKAKRRKTAT